MNPISHFFLELKLNQMELYRSISNLTSFQFYFFKIYAFPPQTALFDFVILPLQHVYFIHITN